MGTYVINKSDYKDCDCVNFDLKLNNNYIYEIIDSKLERRDKKYKVDKWKSAIKRRRR